MSLQFWNALAPLATFVVGAATAITAIVHLRHTSGSNQISAFSKLQETLESPQLGTARAFITARIGDIAWRPAVSASDQR